MANDLNAAELFALEMTDSFIDLNRITATTRRRVVSMLRVLEADLVRELRRVDLGSIVSTPRRLRRLEALLRDVRATLATRYSGAERRLLAGLREAAPFANDAAIQVVNGVFRVNVIRPIFTREDLRTLTDRDIILGAPLEDWWSEQREATRRRFAREMRMGVLRGETNDELVKRLRGGSTGKTISIELPNGKSRRIREYAGGFMDISRRQADGLVRTATQSISNSVIEKTYEQNADIIKGVEALTTLDARTSKICMARTGAAWDLTTGEPLPRSTRQETYPGPPPWHPNCRTTLSPITFSWDELIEMHTGTKLGQKLNSVPDSQRASMDGLINTGKVKTFDDWLRIKGDTFAREKLGPGLFDLWKSGKITTSQLIDAGGNPLTLRELRRR